MVKKRTILGHFISWDGIEADKAKTTLIVNLWSETSEVFSWTCSFYHHFIKDFSKIAYPLTYLLAMDVPFHFSEECLITFTKLKKALASTPALYPSI